MSWPVRAPRRSAHSLVALALFVVSCGGGSPPAASPGERADRGNGADSDDTRAAVAHREVERRCTDGTCFECGDGICPYGYYCDESGEPACSWLPACAAQPSCGCLKNRLGPGCSCEERGEGLFVTCR
jgi:hypothetical protein